MSNSLRRDSPAPKRATWKAILITVACVFLLTCGGVYGLVSTCNFSGDRRQSDAVAWVAIIGVLVFGLIWGSIEFALFAVRRFKNSGL